MPPGLAPPYLQLRLSSRVKVDGAGYAMAGKREGERRSEAWFQLRRVHAVSLRMTMLTLRSHDEDQQREPFHKEAQLPSLQTPGS